MGKNDDLFDEGMDEAAEARDDAYRAPAGGRTVKKAEDRPAPGFYREEAPARASYDQPDRDRTYNAIEMPRPEFTPSYKRVVAITCPKGGVGKSTISKELGIAFASDTYDKNGKPLKVLIVDADWGHPSQPTLFDISERSCPKVSQWINVMAGQEDTNGTVQFFNQRYVENYVVHVRDNLDVLPLTNSTLDADMLDEKMVQAIIQSLAYTDYDVIIYDNRNNAEEDPRTLAIMESADVVAVILTREAHTLKNVAEMLKSLHSIKFDTNRLCFVENSVPTKDRNPDITSRDLENAFGMQLVTEIPSFDNISKINNSAASAVESYPNNPYSKAIYELAEYILPAPKKEKKGFFSWLKRK